MQINGSSQLSFGSLRGRKIVGTFDGGALSSDGGVVAVAEADKRLGITAALAALIPDHRQPEKVVHALPEMIAQRVYQIACGYEDCSDADDLRRDPMFKLAVGRLPGAGTNLASQPTLSRLENSVSRTQLRRMAEVLIDLFLDHYRSAEPARIVLDFDATEDPAHGQQQFATFNGHYGKRCYLPLLVTAQVDGGPHELLVAMLRRGTPTEDGYTLAVLKRLVARLRDTWPEVQIVLRADADFCRPELLDWCEEAANRVDYLICIAKNPVLLRRAEPYQQQAQAKFDETGKKVRTVHETSYAAGTWTKERRVVVKAEVSAEGPNPRFVVTSLSGGTPLELYDEYAMRGEMENRI
jgi:hypothetical protein